MLITLIVIGVVAALTLPTLISRMHTKAMERKEEVFNQRLANGLREMAVKSTLMGYENSYEFAKELSNHYKIFGIYDTDNIGEVYAVVDVIINNEGDTISVSSIKKPKNLKLKDDETHVWANPVAILTTDGTPFIFSYNKKCALTESDINGIQDSKTKQSGDYTQITSCIAGVYDINGVKVPNKQNVDIISFNGGSLAIGCSGTSYNGSCVVNIGFNYQSLNTCDGSEYLKWDTRGSYNAYCATNMWAGAKKACADMDMRLPTFAELKDIYENRANYKVSSWGAYWSVTDENRTDYIYFIDFGTGKYTGRPKSSNYFAICYDN